MGIPLAAASSVRIPTLRDKVYKDECMYTFDTALSPDGLYTSLTTFQSFGLSHVRSHFARHGYPLYLRQQFRRVRKAEAPATNGKDASNSAPTKMAIGVEGGFNLAQTPYDLIKRYSIVCFPGEEEVLYPSEGIPKNVADAVEAVLNRDGVEASDAAIAWEEEERKESKYARALEQLPATEEKRRVLSDPAQWVCEDSGMKKNLWLNLSTGHVGSGRKMWDGTGGTGASLEHFEKTGAIYPLVVKLGTITPLGADVYSYAPDENEMVLDPLLKEHLAHWGIDMDQQEKTEKTMTELQIQVNAAYDFSKITESGSELVPLVGPGYVGFDNLGNSCYMASVLQLLFAIPEVRARYFHMATSIFDTATVDDPSNDLLAMTAKLALGLFSKKYSQPIPIYERLPEVSKPGELPAIVSPRQDGDDVGASVRPFMFKRLIGKNHPEFSSSRQQDASEFYQHLIDKLADAEYAGARGRLQPSDGNLDNFLGTVSLFSYLAEERLECQQSRKSRYLSKVDNMLSLPIPLEKATNTQLYKAYEDRTIKRQKLGAENKTEKAAMEEDEPVKLCVPFEACLESFAAEEHISGFLSPATSKTGAALKRTRFRTFPEYLVVQLKKYTYDSVTLAPKKLDVVVPMPLELDLESLRSSGPGPREDLLPEDEEEVQEQPPQPEADPAIVSQLMAMGFSENGSKRAALATNNSGAQAGMEWVFAHLEDPDFNDPLPAPVAVGPNSASPVNDGIAQEAIVALQGMGFTDKQARASLQTSNGSLELAANWLFNNAEDLDAAVEAVLSKNAASSATERTPVGKPYIDGSGKYSLLGFASHIGNSTNCGHYVSHILKENRFVLFNDGKVAVSQAPPTDLGFLYLYKRQV